MSKLDKSTIAWKKKRFDEVAVIANGQVDPRIEPYCREIHIGPENIESHTGRIINLQKAEELGLISGKYVFDENSIIYSKIRPNLNKLCQPSFRGICSADMYPIWAKEEINKSYLYYFMQSPAFYNQAIKSSMRTGIPKINRQDLNRIKITYPVDHAVQNRIVNTISVWDNAIEKTEALISAKEKQFEWFCTNLLSGRKKSFGFTGKSIPTAFGSIFSLFKKVNTSCADYEVLSVTKDGIVSQSEYFNKEVASKDKSKYLIVDKDTLVMSGLNFWMGAIDFQTIRDTGIVSPAYKTFKVNEGPYSRDYLRFFIRSHYMTKILLDSSIQGASIVRRNLDMEWLSNSLIDLPNLEEQIDIANILSLAEKEIDGLKLLAEKYRSQKRGLMQKLLTGEWQVGSSQHLSEETCQELSREGVA